MSPEELEHLTAHIEKIIKLTVNGKIDRLTDRVENYIKTDDDWKEKAQPILEIGGDIRSFGKILFVLLGIAATIIGILKFWK